jgi:hypothetical protein
MTNEVDPDTARLLGDVLAIICLFGVIAFGIVYWIRHAH